MTDDSGTDGPGDRASDSLATLHDAFRAAYRQRKERTIAALRRGDPPVVIRTNDEEMLLLGPAGAERLGLEVDTYDTMKQLSHIAPLAVLLAGQSDEARSEHRDIGKALECLGDMKEPAELAVIVAETRTLLQALDSAAAPGDALLDRYRSAVGAALEQAAHAAAQADLCALGSAMRQVEARIGKRGLARAFLVVCGGHQSRRHELTRQFFRRWLDATLEAKHSAPHHVLYAEDRATVDEVLDLVASRIVDEAIAVNLFADATRLDEDILGQATQELLDCVASVREFGE